MKKISKIAALIIMLSLVGVACGGDDNDNGYEPQEPKAQSEVITGLFDDNSSATVEGLFTDAEWAGVAEKVKAALNEMFDEAGEGVKDNVFKFVFGREGGITIVLEKEPDYNNYSTTRGGYTMYINYAILNNEDALGMALQNAAMAIVAGGEVIPETGKKVWSLIQARPHPVSRLCLLKTNLILGGI